MNVPPVLLVYCRKCDRYIAYEPLHKCQLPYPYQQKRIAERFTHEARLRT